MRKSELVKAVSEKTGQTQRVVESVLDSLGEVVSAVLKAEGDQIKVPGIATLEVKLQKARTGRNPQTGDPIEVPEKLVVKAKSQVEL